MNERQSKLLSAIIDQFIRTGLPVGSKMIIEQGFFHVSGATIRNEMQILSEAGLIEQPHISAGRIPTALGYRTYVKEFMKSTKDEQRVRRKFETLKDQYLKRKDQERVYEAVALLAHMSPNVSFATVPHRERVFYMGLANVMRQPEFIEDTRLASNVAEMLEDGLAQLLKEIDVDSKVRYYISEEHILPQLQSCSMLVTAYGLRDTRGAIGILGPMRMDYPYNTIALELAADLLR